MRLIIPEQPGDLHQSRCEGDLVAAAMPDGDGRQRRRMHVRPAVSAGISRWERRKRLSTLGWSGIENLFRQLFSLGFFFICVRFLQPTDLGIFALALACTAVPGILIDEPIAEALVQQPDATRAAWDTGFTVNLVLAAALLLLLMACGPGLSSFFGKPGLAYALPALGFASLLGALGNVQKAYLARQLRFRVIAQTTLASQLVGGAAAVALAMQGFGYWALIASVGITAGASSAIYAVLSPWKPRLAMDRAVILAHLPYAGYSAGLRTVYLLRDQSPLIIAGLLLSLAEIGYLSLAIRVGRCLGQLFEEVTSRPLLSMMSREQGSRERFGTVLTEVLAMVGLVAPPAYVGLAMLGPVAMPLMFGAAWASAGDLLPMLCVVLGGWLLLHIVAVSLRSRAMGRIALQLCAPAALLDVAIVSATMPYGLRWALMAWAARAVLWLPLVIWVLQRYLDVDLKRLARLWAAPCAASAAMGGLIGPLRHWVDPGLGGLVLTAAAAGCAYAAALVALSILNVGGAAFRRGAASLLGAER